MGKFYVALTGVRHMVVVKFSEAEQKMSIAELIRQQHPKYPSDHHIWMFGSQVIDASQLLTEGQDGKIFKLVDKTKNLKRQGTFLDRKEKEIKMILEIINNK